MNIFSRLSKVSSYIAIPIITLFTTGLAYLSIHGLVVAVLIPIGLMLTPTGIGTPIGIACLIVAGLFGAAWFMTTAAPFYQGFAKWGLRFDRYFGKKIGQQHYLDKAEHCLGEANKITNELERQALNHLKAAKPLNELTSSRVNASIEQANVKLEEAKTLLQQKLPYNEYIQTIQDKLYAKIEKSQHRLVQLQIMIFDLLSKSSKKAAITNNTSVSNIHLSATPAGRKHRFSLAHIKCRSSVLNNGAGRKNVQTAKSYDSEYNKRPG